MTRNYQAIIDANLAARDDLQTAEHAIAEFFSSTRGVGNDSIIHLRRTGGGQMTDLKPGYVRVFQCEVCWAVFDPRVTAATNHDLDGGFLQERILADPDVVRRGAIVRLGELIHDDEIEWPNTITEESIDEACRALSEREEEK